MIYSAQRGVLFTHVSRTGGMAITQYLRDQLPDVVEMSGQHAPLIAARSVLGPAFDHAFKFAIVRNPWDRFVSWHALIGKTQLGNKTEPAVIAEPDHEHWKGFDEFLERWAADEYEIEGVRRCSLSQWAQLSDLEDKLLADKIGRYETLNDDFANIIRDLELPLQPLSLINHSPRQHYSLYYSDFGRELVGHHYRQDIAGFGYRFESNVVIKG
jgi:hypothetical protein